KILEHTAASASGGMTPAYAAPEFLQGKATRWSDQYCLAVTYCHLCGGRLPFEGSAVQVMAGHTMHAPDLTMLPEHDGHVVGRALAKKPEERWPSCREFVQALAAAVEAGSALRFLPVQDLMMQPGEERMYGVQMERGTIKGPIELRVESLPGGVMGWA